MAPGVPFIMTDIALSFTNQDSGNENTKERRKGCNAMYYVDVGNMEEYLLYLLYAVFEEDGLQKQSR